MVSFELDEIETLSQAMVHELALNDIRPVAATIDAGSAIPLELAQSCWRTGIVQALLDEAPGIKRSRTLSCVILEELGWADASTAVAVGASMAFAQAIMDYGTSSQREDLKASAVGDAPLTAAILIQEPGLASHPGAIATSAVEAGDMLRLSGTKSSVPLAAQATSFLVLARLEGSIQAIVVPADAPGVAVEAPKGSMGLRGLGLTEVRFDAVELPRDARLGGANGCEAKRLIASSRAGIASILTGLSRAVFEHIAPYTKERVAHGTALARKQSVAFRLADMFIDIPSMRWMAWRAASELQKGRDGARRRAADGRPWLHPRQSRGALAARRPDALVARGIGRRLTEKERDDGRL